jgi:hypothetical protein
VESGRRVRELRPLEQPGLAPVEGLLWEPGGKYVIAVSRDPHGSSARYVDVWSLASGRHRGRFARSVGVVTGLAATPDGQALIVGRSGRAPLYGTSPTH